MFSLKDKVALVTGASQGIGRDTALALSEAGAKVAVAARSEEKLVTLVNEIVGTEGGQAFAVKMDVADAEQVKAGFKQVLDKFGRLDILVNNAAITRDGLALRMKQDDWEAVSTHRTDYQYRVRRRANGQCRPGELCRRKGRSDWTDESHCHRDRFAQHHCECGRARLHQDAHDGCFAR